MTLHHGSGRTDTDLEIFSGDRHILFAYCWEGVRGSQPMRFNIYDRMYNTTPLCIFASLLLLIIFVLMKMKYVFKLEIFLQMKSSLVLFFQMANSWDNRIKFLVRYMYDLDNNGYLNKNDFDCLAVKFTVMEGKGEWNKKR